MNPTSNLKSEPQPQPELTPDDLSHQGMNQLIGWVKGTARHEPAVRRMLREYFANVEKEVAAGYRYGIGALTPDALARLRAARPEVPAAPRFAAALA